MMPDTHANEYTLTLMEALSGTSMHVLGASSLIEGLFGCCAVQQQGGHGNTSKDCFRGSAGVCLPGLGWGTHTHSRWPGVGQLSDRRVRTTMSGLRHSCSGSILMVRLHLPEPAGLPSSVLGLLAPALGASLTASCACRETEHSAISQHSLPSLTALVSPATVLRAKDVPHSKGVPPANGVMWHLHECGLHEEWS